MSSPRLVKDPRAVDAERRHQDLRPRTGPSRRSATRPSRYVAARRSRRWRALRPLGRPEWRFSGPWRRGRPLPTAAPSPCRPQSITPVRTLHPLAEASAQVAGAGLRAGGEVPRPLVGGLGDRPPRPRRRGGEPPGTRPCRRTGGRAGTSPRRRAGSGSSGRLAGRPDPEDRGLASRITRRRDDVGAAGRADLRAADRFVNSAWLEGAAPSVARPSRLKRTPFSTSVAGRSPRRRRRRPFDVRLARDGHDDRDEGDEGGERHQRRQRSRGGPAATAGSQPPERAGTRVRAGVRCRHVRARRASRSRRPLFQPAPQARPGRGRRAYG